MWNHTSLHSQHPVWPHKVWAYSSFQFRFLSFQSFTGFQPWGPVLWWTAYLPTSDMALDCRQPLQWGAFSTWARGALQEVDHCSWTPSTNCLMLSHPSRSRTFLPDTTAHYKSFRDAWFRKEHTDIYSMWGEQSVFTAHKSPHCPLSSQWDLTCKTVCRLWHHLRSTCASVS